MRVILKNRVTNTIAAGILAACVFIITLVIAGVVCIMAGILAAVHVAGGISYGVVKWFDNKYVELNKQ